MTVSNIKLDIVFHILPASVCSANVHIFLFFLRNVISTNRTTTYIDTCVFYECIQKSLGMMMTTMSKRTFVTRDFNVLWKL